MRTVLLAAASTLCLAFAAHSAPAHHARAHRTAGPSPAAAGLVQALPSVAPQGTDCLERGASLSRAAFTTDDDAGSDDSAMPHCSQFLSTQMLMTPPAHSRT
jgi:hypothetical protein